MNSLKEVFSAMTDQDHVKLAQAHAVEQYGPDFSEVDPELVKTAEAYDTIGRVLAENVYADMVKQAMDESMPHASEDEKKKQIAKYMAKAKGEDSDEEDEKKDEGGEGEEKKAAIQAAILDRMASDPEYVSYLVAKHHG